MKKIWKYSLLIAGVLAVAVSVRQLTRSESTGIFYRVTGERATVYILGSIHVGSRDMYPLSRDIADALHNADTVVFECDTTSEEAQMVTAQIMQSQIPLSERVGAECMALVEKAAQKLGYSLETIQKLDPWAVTSMMTVAAAAEKMNNGNSKVASTFGVENMVRKQLKNQQISYLESAEYQLGLMENLSPGLQEYLLVSACEAVVMSEDANAGNKEIEKWPEWWKKGNAQAFADSYIQEMQEETSPEMAYEYHQALLSTRNHHMTEKLCEMLEDEQGNQYFAVIGLMHLVLPDDSIIAELEAKGYHVERIAQ